MNSKDASIEQVEDNRTVRRLLILTNVKLLVVHYIHTAWYSFFKFFKWNALSNHTSGECINCTNRVRSHTQDIIGEECYVFDIMSRHCLVRFPILS